jgi:hypothetical protein
MGIQHVVAIAIPVVIIGGIVLVIVAIFRGQKRRREEWEQEAMRLGYTYQKEDANVVSRFGHLELFNRGSSRRATNVLIGRNPGADVTLLDYSYSTGSGRSRSTHVSTVCVQCSAALNLPHVQISPEFGLVSRFFELLGAQDIDFPEDEAFSKAFVVKGENVEAVRQLLGPALRMHLLQFRPKYHSFEGKGDTWLIHYNQLVKPTDAAELIMRAAEIINYLRASERSGW